MIEVTTRDEIDRLPQGNYAEVNPETGALYVCADSGGFVAVYNSAYWSSAVHKPDQ